MNHFKKVNDTFGHTAGDKCLCTVAQGLREVYGISGRSFRLGANFRGQYQAWIWYCPHPN